MDCRIVKLDNSAPEHETILKLYKYYNALIPLFTYYENARGVFITEEEAHTARILMEKLESYLLPRLSDLTKD